MLVEFIHPQSGHIRREVNVSGEVRLSDVINELLMELGINVSHRDLEPYYLVVINGNQLNEGISWDKVKLKEGDHVVLMPFASGGSPLLSRSFNNC